jgi:hypothetical protein
VEFKAVNCLYKLGESSWTVKVLASNYVIVSMSQSQNVVLHYLDEGVIEMSQSIRVDRWRSARAPTSSLYTRCLPIPDGPLIRSPAQAVAVRYEDLSTVAVC